MGEASTQCNYNILSNAQFPWKNMTYGPENGRQQKASESDQISIEQEKLSK